MHLGFFVAQRTALVCMCARARGRWGHHVHSLSLESRRAVIGAGGGGHMGAVTSRQRYANPLTDLDEVRLSNPRKTKVQSVRADKSSTTAEPPVWENFTSLGLMQPFNYEILMMERSRAFTLLMLMVSKCSLVKMCFLLS